MNIFYNSINKLISGKKRVNPSRRIAVGFIVIILIGALLLMLPVSSKERVVTPFLTALFTTTSATCVTGLTLVDTGSYYSIFGQIVILILIQLGGLGFMSIFTIVFFALHKQIGIRSRMLIARTLGVESLEGVVRLVKMLLKATLLFEGCGAVLLSVRFIPEFGFVKGIWFSIFHSVSAFCNAGFDVLGKGNSIISYQSDPVVILTLGILVIIGGIGFAVWRDVLNCKSLKRLSPYSKLVFIMSIVLLAAGAVGFFAFERTNPETIANQSPAAKALSALFQSITTRTAGFDSIGQEHLTQKSKLLSIMLMMIGGASGSTAGGVKVATVGVALITLKSVLTSKDDAIVFGRKIRYSSCIYALALIFLWVILTAAGALLINVADDINLIDAFYEVASAYGTVGLTSGATAASSVASKILLMLYMFFGRVGIMTISVTFTIRSKKNAKLEYPDADILIG